MRIRLPPSLSIFLSVGRAPRILVSSVILPFSSRGTLKSTRTIAFLPLKLKSSIFAILGIVYIISRNRCKDNKKNRNSQIEVVAESSVLVLHQFHHFCNV